MAVRGRGPPGTEGGERSAIGTTTNTRPPTRADLYVRYAAGCFPLNQNAAPKVPIPVGELLRALSVVPGHDARG